MIEERHSETEGKNTPESDSQHPKPKSEIRILIAEDSPVQAETLRHTLVSEGYAVSVAKDGADGLSKAKELRPELIISDILMPEMDGYTLCQEIKSDENLKDIPVILMTSLSSPQDVINGLECGADNFITKPYDKKYLLSCIHYILINQELLQDEKLKMGLEIFFAGKKYFITSERQQILGLLLSTYEAAVRKNQELLRAQDELRELNEQLEKKVEERTFALKEEITERKRAEDTIKQLSHQNELILNSAGEGILGLDLQGNHTFVNPAAARMLGYKVEELIGKHSHSTWHHSKADGSPYPDKECPIYTSYRDGKIHTRDDEVFWRKDGTSFPVRYTSTPIIEDGKILGAVASFRDITERKRTDESLRESEKRYKRLVESTTNYIYSVEIENGKPVSTKNGSGCVSVTGYTSEEYEADPSLWYRMIHGKDREAVVKQTDRLFSGGVVEPFEHRIIHKDGSIRWVRNTPVPRYDKQGRLISYDGLIADITERKLAEEALTNAYAELEMRVAERTRELEDANLEFQFLNKELNLRRKEAEDAKLQAITASRAKSDFLANMSHELRTPLNAIIGFSDMMFHGMTGKLTEQQIEYLGDIRESGEHLLSLINDILDLSKVEAGKIELELSEFDLKELFEESLVMFKEKALKHNMKVRYEVDERTGSITADERRLKQVMFNLLSNAFKFTPDGGSVFVRARKQTEDEKIRSYEVEKKLSSSELLNFSTSADFIEISVEDTGIGIRHEDIDKLFQPFQQLEHTLTKKYEGTGLGLTLCKRIVELHNGRIWVESEVGKGSKFTFVIPVIQTTRT